MLRPGSSFRPLFLTKQRPLQILPGLVLVTSQVNPRFLFDVSRRNPYLRKKNVCYGTERHNQSLWGMEDSGIVAAGGGEMVFLRCRCRRRPHLTADSENSQHVLGCVK